MWGIQYYVNDKYVIKLLIFNFRSCFGPISCLLLLLLSSSASDKWIQIAHQAAASFLSLTAHNFTCCWRCGRHSRLYSSMCSLSFRSATGTATVAVDLPRHYLPSSPSQRQAAWRMICLQSSISRWPHRLWAVFSFCLLYLGGGRNILHRCHVANLRVAWQPDLNFAERWSL